MTRQMKTLTSLAALTVVLGACSWSARQADYGYSSSIPLGANVTVQQGDTVYEIAKANKVSMRDLIALNQLQSPYSLQPGQSLMLPAYGRAPASGSWAASPAPAGAVTAEALPPAGSYGTAYSSPYNNPSYAAASPSGYPPYENQGSTVISTSPALGQSRSGVAVQELPPPSQNQQMASLSQPLPPVQPLQQPMTQPYSYPQAAISPPSYPGAEGQAVPRAIENVRSELGRQIQRPSEGVAPVFIWPVRGPVVSAFGPKGDGLNNDGVNISAPRGAQVAAAAGGTVVYAGNEMKGFGNLVLIRHEGGWITAYAHLERVTVERDSVVAQGDIIGTVGSSGGVPSPQLHFEIRDGGKPIDPEPYLGAS